MSVRLVLPVCLPDMSVPPRRRETYGVRSGSEVGSRVILLQA